MVEYSVFVGVEHEGVNGVRKTIIDLYDAIINQKV